MADWRKKAVLLFCLRPTCKLIKCLRLCDFCMIRVSTRYSGNCLFKEIFCYTSTQNTCTRLVQITSCDAHKYAIVTSSAIIMPSQRALLSIVLWSRLINIWDIYDNADAERYVIRYQQATMFILSVESIKYHKYKFCVETLRYIKTNRDWPLDHYWKFLTQSL